MAYPHKWSPISYRLSAGQRSSQLKDRRSTTVPHNQPDSWDNEYRYVGSATPVSQRKK